MARRIPLLIVVWLIATLFYLGDLGKYSDDYALANHDPVTGVPAQPTALTIVPLSRPLNWVVLNEVSRVLWLDDQAFHLANAVAHGVVVTLLVILLIALGRSSTAATAAGVLFLAYPAHFEVVFWPAALPIALACSVFLIVCLAAVWFARCDAERARWRSRGILLAMALLGFVIPCLYEQTAAGLAALPLLSLAAAPDGSARRRRSSVLPALAACGGAAAYLVLYWATAPPGMRGTVATLPRLEVVADEAGRLALEVAHRLSLHAFGSGAVLEGLRSLLAAPGAAAGIAVVGAATVWLARRSGPERAIAAARTWPLVAFGVAVFGLGWLPLLAAPGTPASSRLTYAPCLGLAIALAAVLDGVTYGRVVRQASERRMRGLVNGAVTLAGVLACLAMVGVQAGYRARTHADTALGQSVKLAVPEPPPETMFLVLDDARRPIETDAAAFDNEFTSALLLPQAATPWIRWAYGRRDLFAAQAIPWGARIVGVDDAGVRIVGLEPAFPMQLAPDPRGGVVVPWSQLIPLRVDRDGAVHVEDQAVVRAQRS